MLRVGSRRYFPDANGPTLSLKTCLFTNTPDEHFIIDRYPGLEQVVLASPCSGHGFKFASVLGEVLADMVMDRTPAFDLSWLGLDRFAGRERSPTPDPARPDIHTATRPGRS